LPINLKKLTSGRAAHKNRIESEEKRRRKKKDWRDIASIFKK